MLTLKNVPKMIMARSLNSFLRSLLSNDPTTLVEWDESSKPQVTLLASFDITDILPSWCYISYKIYNTEPFEIFSGAWVRS